MFFQIDFVFELKILNQVQLLQINFFFKTDFLFLIEFRGVKRKFVIEQVVILIYSNLIGDLHRVKLFVEGSKFLAWCLHEFLQSLLKFVINEAYSFRGDLVN